MSVSVSDSNGGSDSITVTINVTDTNDPPVFTDGATATRAIAENTAADTNIGTPVAATDQDGDRLEYMYDFFSTNPDHDAFTIDSTSGQIKTKAALDYETKSSYQLNLMVLDSGGTASSISVTINVTDLNEVPVFTDGDSTTRSVAENTTAGQNIGTPVAATIDVDNYTLIYTLGGTDAASFSIVSTSGQLQTSAALDYETKNSYSVTVSVSDGHGGSDSIPVTINVTNVNETPANNSPIFTDGTSATRTVAENTTSGENIGAAVAATDVDSGTTLTYTLGGTDAASFSIVSTSGQLQTSAALNYETKTSYSVTVDVSDGNDGSDSIPVTINVTNVNEAPSFTDGSSATRSIAEKTAANTNIGSAFTATDVDANTTLTYTLGGTDVAAFSINDTTGQLQTSAALDYETKHTYSVTVTVSDGSLIDSILVTINVTNVNEDPNFTDGSTATRTVADNAVIGTNIGAAIAATDGDNDSLTYTLISADTSVFTMFSIDRTSGQLQTKAVLDYETKSSYSCIVSVSDGNGGHGEIAVTINVTTDNYAPVFTDGNSTTRSIAENTASGINIGSPVAATDAEDDTLTYSLNGTDAASFSIVSTSGQLRTSTALDFETKSSYSVTVSVSDGNGKSDSISVSINVTNVNDNAPVFTDGISTTRTVEENTASGFNIGSTVSATDADTGDTLTYTLGGTDAASFSIVATSGQLQTSAALDYETKSSYSVTVSASDGNGGSDTITVTVNVTDVNENNAQNNAPVFSDGTTTARSIAENTVANVNIGTAVSATDADTGDTLTYTLGGTDASSFSIVATSGQLQTSAALDYETKSSYSVTVSVSDGNGGHDTITVTINITDVVLPIRYRSPGVRDAIAVALKSNNPNTLPISALASITTLHIEGKSIGSLKIEDFNGLTNLKTLRLTQDTISDISSLSGLTKLTTLHLSSNSIVDLSPLSGLTKLTWLVLNGNSIVDLSPLSGLTKLTYLSLRANSISDPSPLSGLTKLTYLNLEQNSISDISSLSGLTKLESLVLSGNSISNISHLSGLTELEFLGLGRNSISDISHLSGLTKLTRLNLRANSISDLSPLSGLTKLYILQLGGTSINNSALSALSSLTSIRKFFLYGTSVSDLSALSSWTTLEVLGLTNNKNLSDISTLTNWTSSLEYLYLTHNNISDVSPLIGLTSGLDLFELRGNPIPLSQYATLRALAYRPDDIDITNEPPVFTEGNSTTRTVAENTAAGTNIGNPIAATDTEKDRLTYSLSGTDAALFRIVSKSGQLRTKVALDFETKTSYTVTVDVSGDAADNEQRDSYGNYYYLVASKGLDRITVTINVTDVVGSAPSVETPPPLVLPKTTELLSNFPNPFNPETWIPYQLAKPAEVTLTIYDIRGRVVRTLRLGHQPAGMYRSRSKAAYWDGRNYLGEKVATGIYFYTLKAGDYTATRKLLIRK